MSRIGGAGFTPVPPGDSTDGSSRDAGDARNAAAKEVNSRSLHALRSKGVSFRGYGEEQ
jgi:hypothetical protein